MWESLTDSTRWIDTTTAWMLTYLLHSTLLLGLAFVVSRRLADRFLSIKETMWRAAIVGGLLTATLQVGLGIDPLAGSWQVARGSSEEVAAITHLQLEAGAARPARLSSPQAVIGQVPPTVAAHSLSRWLLTGWLAIGISLLALITTSYIRLLRRLDSRHRLTDGPLPALLRRLVTRVDARPTHLAASTEIVVPLARGIRRREICLPERMVSGMPEEQMEIVLAHELAHLERRDPLWLLAMRAFESVFFFQPLNRLARRSLQEIAEYRCDDWAVSRTGRPVGMARCLTDVAGWSVEGRLPDLVPTMAVDRSQLGRRVSRLLARNYPAPTTPAPRWLGTAALLLLALVTLVAPGVTGASAPPSTAPEVIVLGAEDPADNGVDGRDATTTDDHSIPTADVPATPVVTAAPTTDIVAAVAPVPPVAPVTPRAKPATAPVPPVAPRPWTHPAVAPSDHDIDDLALQIEARLEALAIDMEPLQIELDQLTIDIDTQVINSAEIEALVREASELASSFEIPEETLAELESRALALAGDDPLTPEQREALSRLAHEATQMAIDPELTARLSEISVEIRELAVPDPETLARISEISAEMARAYAPSAEEIRQLVEASTREYSMTIEERDRLREVAREEAGDPATDEPMGSWEESEVDGG